MLPAIKLRLSNPFGKLRYPFEPENLIASKQQNFFIAAYAQTEDETCKLCEHFFAIYDEYKLVNYMTTI